MPSNRPTHERLHWSVGHDLCRQIRNGVRRRPHDWRVENGSCRCAMREGLPQRLLCKHAGEVACYARSNGATLKLVNATELLPQIYSEYGVGGTVGGRYAWRPRQNGLHVRDTCLDSPCATGFRSDSFGDGDIPCKLQHDSQPSKPRNGRVRSRSRRIFVAASYAEHAHGCYPRHLRRKWCWYPSHQQCRCMSIFTSPLRLPCQPALPMRTRPVCSATTRLLQ